MNQIWKYVTKMNILKVQYQNEPKLEVEGAEWTFWKYTDQIVFKPIIF